ncbi:MAG: hypothetical protein R3C15_07520 [Thermoleophilia bacterium]
MVVRALRDLRYEWKGWALLLACVVLAVAVYVGVGLYNPGAGRAEVTPPPHDCVPGDPFYEGGSPDCGGP